MGDPGFKFDFEHSLPAMAAPAAPTDLPPSMRKNYRQVALLLLCSFLLNAHLRKVGRSHGKAAPAVAANPRGLTLEMWMWPDGVPALVEGHVHEG